MRFCISNVTIADYSAETITDVGLDFSEVGYRNKPEFPVLNLTIPNPLCKFLSETQRGRFQIPPVLSSFSKSFLFVTYLCKR